LLVKAGALTVVFRARKTCHFSGFIFEGFPFWEFPEIERGNTGKNISLHCRNSGHNMTSMRQNSSIFLMPRRSDVTAVEKHQQAVFNHFGEVFQDIDVALRGALPKVKNTFALHEGPVDLAVHAPWTRYLVRLDLSKRSNSVFDEDDVEFDLLRVSNCGLCIRTAQGDIRILKSAGDGLPKAHSDARISFVANNQMSFFFAEETAQLRTLNLFVLWRTDAEHQYLGMDIACPKETRDKGDIDCYWIAPWRKSSGVTLNETQVLVATDLDEIVAIPAENEKNIAK
jgi:hypothetical protein